MPIRYRGTRIFPRSLWRPSRPINSTSCRSRRSSRRYRFDEAYGTHRRSILLPLYRHDPQLRTVENTHLSTACGKLARVKNRGRARKGKICRPSKECGWILLHATRLPFYILWGKFLHSIQPLRIYHPVLLTLHHGADPTIHTYENVLQFQVSRIDAAPAGKLGERRGLSSSAHLFWRSTLLSVDTVASCDPDASTVVVVCSHVRAPKRHR